MVDRTIILSEELQGLVDRAMAAGSHGSRDDLLRDALTHWIEHRDSLVELDRALDQAQGGQTRTWDDFRREFRLRNNLSAESP